MQKQRGKAPSPAAATEHSNQVFDFSHDTDDSNNM